ncbi:Nucleoside-diphosphate-sugar epimerase [Lacrimispora sphenoides]|uniref:NAD-dependent epimerase/dehydratase family protein n=1 Tax=Lacrimispora sphenoides TaxID=29370 RepID=UPI0008B32297|nr:NAD-dependent epimerase/dehydratase family protein [Lacrimispora sphenoides]SEU26446.1 Nucleoside-diphosphate-sugar epimerase [Lacrimispora sphenoides]
MKKKALIIGGSGGLSGRLAALAKDEYEVWAVTRGQRPLGDGIHLLKADRNDTENFRKTILEADTNWDIVFDCICMNERHALQDLDVLPGITKRLVVISTDSVYDPLRKDTPQNEDGYFVEEEGEPEALTYAGNKRRMEHIFINNFSTSLVVTLFRPGHIYGPGFLIGCYPEHSRQKELPQLILDREPISLVGGGIYLTQPIFVDDLANSMLDCAERQGAFNRIFCIGGPKAVENRRYYEIIGQLLDRDLTIKEIPLTGYLEDHPEYSGHLCHRIYDLSALREAGVRLPDTPLETGLNLHLKSLGYL